MIASELFKYLIPPKRPLFAGSPKEWADVESRLGIRFPQDYKWYVTHYGQGGIDELEILNPFTSNPYRRLDLPPESKAGTRLEHLRLFRQGEFAADFPFPPFPEAGGLLPWGAKEARVTLYWLAIGDPDTWKIVLEDLRGPTEVKVFSESLTSFLVGILSSRIQHSAFEKFPSQVPMKLNL